MGSLITFIAFVVDWIIGDPHRWPHPVRLIGRLITAGEKQARRLAGNDPAGLRLAGAFLALVVVGVTMVTVWAILSLGAWVSAGLWFFIALYLVYSAFCLKDLYFQTWRVEKALKAGFLDEARQMLSWVVGRDTADLDEAGIRRALIETLAENLSDGLVAPMFYLALGGPVLVWGYKAINTLDSMVGYKNERYLHLGRFSAKLDDAANYVPARLAALLIVGAARLKGYDWRGAKAVWKRDGHLHSSPNSGQPEAAMAGALGLWLGGSSSYGGVMTEKPKINDGGREPNEESVKAAESLMVGAAMLMLVLVMVFMLLFTGFWGWA